ncbi:hypothetical protein AB0D35_20190 [Streptomyces sp. NPDC048301]|uniref:hypothetical protein n=1 Tax=Streptomyces sp. NPDC048301 TaxID=3155631 RepID=UPI003418D8F9
MLSHRFERGVLVLTVREDPGIGGRAELSSEIVAFLQAHRPSPVLVVIEEAAATPATASAVLRAHRQCGAWGVLMSVATASSAVRRLLEASADVGGARLAVHQSLDSAFNATYGEAA